MELKTYIALPEDEPVLHLLEACGYSLTEQQPLFARYEKDGLQIALCNIFGITVRKDKQVVARFPTLNMSAQEITIALQVMKIIDVRNIPEYTQYMNDEGTTGVPAVDTYPAYVSLFGRDCGMGNKSIKQINQP